MHAVGISTLAKAKVELIEEGGGLGLGRVSATHGLARVGLWNDCPGSSSLSIRLNLNHLGDTSLGASVSMPQRGLMKAGELILTMGSAILWARVPD